MKYNVFDSDKYMVEFDLLAKSVATNEDLNGVIMSIITTSRVNSLSNLCKISDVIFNRLKKTYNFDESVIRDFSDCISGVKYYKAKYQMESVNEHLPHVSKLCINIMSQTKVTDAMIMDQKIKESVREILPDIESGNNKEEISTQLTFLQTVANIAYKNNPIIDKAISKYVLDEKDINLEEIISKFNK